MTAAKVISRRLAYDIGYGLSLSSIYIATDPKSYVANGVDSSAGLISRKEKRPKLAYFAFQALCTLFEGTSKAHDIGMNIQPPSGTRINSVIPYNAVQSAAFRRNGIPMYSWFLPEREVISAEVLMVEAIVMQRPEDSFTDPVVIDPLRQNIYRIENVEYPAWAKGLMVLQLPTVDYPLFITDLSLIKDCMG